MLDTLTIVHMIISVLLIVFVLLQFGKGAEAGIFSSDSGGAAFTGAQSGNILTKITTVLTICFLGLSLSLSVMRSNSSENSVFSDTPMSEPVKLNYDKENKALDKKSEDGAKTPAPKADGNKPESK